MAVLKSAHHEDSKTPPAPNMLNLIQFWLRYLSSSFICGGGRWVCWGGGGYILLPNLQRLFGNKTFDMSQGVHHLWVG